MSTAVDPVAAALAAANAAAQQQGNNATQNAAAAQQATTGYPPAQVPAVAGNTNLPAMPGKTGPIDLDEIGGSFLSVDGFLGASEAGLQVGKVGFHEKIIVGFRLTELITIEKLSFSNPTRYYDTLDRVTCRQGGAWAEKLAEAARLSTPQKQIRPFVTADIPMTVVEEAKDHKGNVVEAGRLIGFTPPWSATADLKKVKDEAKRLGIDAVLVECTPLTTKNKGNEKYSRVVMKFLGEWDGNVGGA